MRLNVFSEKTLVYSRLQKRTLKVPLLNIYAVSPSLFTSQPLSNLCHTIVLDLPPGEKLDDLASLLQLDTKNMKVTQLGIDVIKEQQRINLKFSSNKTAVLPEDKAQTMLAAVSNISFLLRVRTSFRSYLNYLYVRTRLTSRSFFLLGLYSCSSLPAFWKLKHVNFAVTPFVYKQLLSVELPLPTSWI